MLDHREILYMSIGEIDLICFRVGYQGSITPLSLAEGHTAIET